MGHSAAIGALVLITIAKSPIVAMLQSANANSRGVIERNLTNYTPEHRPSHFNLKIKRVRWSTALTPAGEQTSLKPRGLKPSISKTVKPPALR